MDEGVGTTIERFYVPFSFEENGDNSEFQIIEILGEYEYRYGFEYNAECIVTEWLYRKNLKTNRTATIFERTTQKMDKKFFRRDQIWFVQKDEFGYSELSALSDFKVRSDASFEKDYLAGVYGGIPLLKEFDMKEGE